MNEAKTENKKQNKEQKQEQNKSLTQPRTLSDLRAPLMLLFISTGIFSQIVQIPLWIILSLMAPAIAFTAFKTEKNLIIELLFWKSPWVIAGAAFGVIFYFTIDHTLQMITNFYLTKGGNFTFSGTLPIIFEMLLSLRSSIGNVPPIVAGLVGGFALAFSEGLFWRGLVLTRLILVLNHNVAALVCAVLYGSFYLLLLGPLAAALAFISGFLFSIFVLRTKTLVPSMAFHFISLVLALWLKPDISQFISMLGMPG